MLEFHLYNFTFWETEPNEGDSIVIESAFNSLSLVDTYVHQGTETLSA